MRARVDVGAGQSMGAHVATGDGHGAKRAWVRMGIQAAVCKRVSE